MLLEAYINHLLVTVQEEVDGQPVNQPSVISQVGTKKMGSCKEESVNIGQVKMFKILTLFQVSPPSPSPKKWPYLHERCLQCWIEWETIFQIFPNFGFWDMACIAFTHIYTNQEIVIQKWSNLYKKKICNLIWPWYFNSWVFLSKF